MFKIIKLTENICNSSLTLGVSSFSGKSRNVETAHKGMHGL